MHPSEKKVFKYFPKVGTFVPNHRLSMMVSQRLVRTVGISDVVRLSTNRKLQNCQQKMKVSNKKKH